MQKIKSLMTDRWNSKITCGAWRVTTDPSVPHSWDKQADLVLHFQENGKLKCCTVELFMPISLIRAGGPPRQAGKVNQNRSMKKV
jgi:hypothetical protein